MIRLRSMGGFWALALALLVGQGVSSHAAFVHHAQMLLATGPMAQVCSVRTDAPANKGVSTRGDSGAEHGAGLTPCCSACAVLSMAPLPGARASTPSPAAQFLRQPVAAGPVAHERIAALPPARAPPARV